MNRRMVLAALAAGCLWAVPAAAQPLDEVQQRIRDAWAGLKSLKAGVSVKASIPAGAGRVPIDGTGVFEYRKTETGEQYRQEVTLRMPADNVEVVTGHVFDGDDLYSFNVVNGTTSVTKDDGPDSLLNPPPGGGPMLDAIGAAVEWRAEPKSTANGRPCFVLVGTAKEAGGGFQRMVLYVDEATGLRLKTEIYESREVLTATVAYDAIETGAEIADDRFAPPVAGAAAPAAAAAGGTGDPAPAAAPAN